MFKINFSFFAHGLDNPKFSFNTVFRYIILIKILIDLIYFVCIFLFAGLTNLDSRITAFYCYILFSNFIFYLMLPSAE